MKEFAYTITDPLGIHARPAGLFVKEAAGFSSIITVSFDGKEVDGKRILSVMSLGAKLGSRIVVRCEGADEEEASEVLENYLKENL